MAKMIGNGNLLGAAKSEETDTGTTTVEISLLNSFEDKVTISQVVCEPKPELERCEDQATVQTTEEPLAVSPPAAPPTPPTANQPETKAPTSTAAQPLEPKPQWSVGAQCQAVWSEDGRLYAATVQSIEGERCRVKFDGYGNEEDVPLSTLKPPEHPPKSTQGVPWRPAFGAGVRRRREVPDVADKRDTERERGERGGRDKIWNNPPHSTWQSKDRAPGPSQEERESEEKKFADRPTNHTFMPLPSFPPPPLPHISGDVPTYVLPPPPFWAFGAKEPSGPLDPTSHMLMLWYMCGFHTGSYLAQQQSKSSSKD